MSAAADAENIWQRLRKRFGNAKKSYEVALRGTATIGRHHKLSTGRYTANRAASPHTAPQQYGRRHYRYCSTQSGREVLSENDQTDGEYDDEEACSCPNTPLKGFVCEAEFTFPPYRPYHHQQDIIGMKGRQAGQPIPPPKPARPQASQLQQQPQQQHVSKQQQQQQYKPEYRSGDSRGTAKEGDRDFHAYHKKVSRGEIVPDPDMTDGYHEFIKGNNSHVNEFSRKYIDFVTPKTFPVGPNSSINGEKQQQICPHGVPIPSTQSEVHTNDSLIKGVDSKKSQSIKDYSKKGDNQVQPTPALSANTANKRVDTAPPPLLKPSAPNKTTTESFRASKVNEVTNSQAVKFVGNGDTAAVKQSVVHGAVNKKSTWDSGNKCTVITGGTPPPPTTTDDRKLVITTASQLKTTENNTPTTSNTTATSVRPATIASSSSSSLPPSCSAAAAGPVGAAGGSICIVSEEAGKLDSACSGTSTSTTSQPQLQQQQVRNKIPPKTKPKPTRGVSGLSVVDKDKKDTNTGHSTDKSNAKKRRIRMR